MSIALKEALSNWNPFEEKGKILNPAEMMLLESMLHLRLDGKYESEMHDIMTALLKGDKIEAYRIRYQVTVECRFILVKCVQAILAMRESADPLPAPEPSAAPNTQPAETSQ